MSEENLEELKKYSYGRYTVTLYASDPLIEARVTDEGGHIVVTNHGKTEEEALDKCKQDLQGLS